MPPFYQPFLEMVGYCAGSLVLALLLLTFAVWASGLFD